MAKKKLNNESDVNNEPEAEVDEKSIFIAEFREIHEKLEKAIVSGDLGLAIQLTDDIKDKIDFLEGGGSVEDLEPAGGEG